MTLTDPRRGTVARLLAVAAALAAALAVLPLSGAAHAQATDPCEGAPQSTFSDRGDIPPVHQPNVDCAAHLDIVSGFADGTFRPALEVRRDQMASFIALTLDAAGVALPAGQANTFTDVGSGNVHADNVNRLAEAGIVQGGALGLPATQYGPALRTRRDQMASFLMRAAGFALHDDVNHFDSTDQAFTDVPSGNTHFTKVNAAAENDITQGVGSGLFAPAQETRRDQMATFVIRLLRFISEDGTVDPGDPQVNIALSDTSGPAGTTVTGTVTGDVDQVASIAVAGDCVEDGDVTLTNGTFSVDIAADAAPGACTLTFTVTFDDGTTQTLTSTFVVGLAIEVALDPTEGPAGTEVTGTVTGDLDELDTLTISGECVTDGDVTVTDGTFTFEIDAAAAEAACDLTFTATFTDGTTQELTATFTVTAPATNQTFTVTPAEGDTVTIGDTQQFTVAGITSDTVDIGLVDCDDVTVDENGIVTFDDSVTTADNNAFDFAAVAAADITVVNGIDVTDGDYVNDVGPTSGEVTFTVETLARGCVVAVVFDDADNDDALDLDANDLPTEAFAVTGDFTIIPAEATEGDAVEGLVLAVGDDYAVVDDTTGTEMGEVTVFFSAEDTFRIQGTTFCSETTEENFFANLSVDDSLSTVIDAAGTAGPYSQTAANDFCLVDLAPDGPTNVAAAPGDPADTTVDVTWTDSTTASVDSYNIYRNDEACGDTTAAELALVASVDAADAAEYEDTGLTPDTTYCYVVTAVDGEDESTLAVGTVVDLADNTDEATTATPIVAPTVESSALTTDSPIEGIADTGDIWTVVFNEDMSAASLADATLSLTDVDGDTILVECNDGDASNTAFITQAICTLGDSEDVDTDGITLDELTIELIEDAADRNAEGDDVIEYTLTITAIDGLTDVDDSAEPDLTASTELTIG